MKWNFLNTEGFIIVKIYVSAGDGIASKYYHIDHSGFDGGWSRDRRDARTMNFHEALKLIGIIEERNENIPDSLIVDIYTEKKFKIWNGIF